MNKEARLFLLSTIIHDLDENHIITAFEKIKRLLEDIKNDE